MKELIAWLIILLLVVITVNLTVNAIDVELSNRARLVPTFMKGEDQ